MTTKPQRVLVADSDVEHRKRLVELVTHVAEQAGLTVNIAEASDGTTALAWCSEHRPALVLSEILLEGLSGLALLRTLRHEKSESTPFVFVTSMDRELDRYWGLRNGAHAYVTKPYQRAALQEWIQRLLTEGPEATPQAPGGLG